jgi:hypothetical protein
MTGAGLEYALRRVHHGENEVAQHLTRLSTRHERDPEVHHVAADLLQVTAECHPQNLRQLRWANSMIKVLSPQALAALDS